MGRTNPEGRFIPGKGPGEFNKPTGVAVSKDRIAVADRNNERVQVFDLSFNFLFQVTLAEAVPAAREPEDDDDGEDGEKEEDEESKPFGVALDRENNIYVTDEENGRILAFDPQGKLLFALGREGKLLGQFENPKGLAAGALKYLYVGDRGNKRVKKIDPFQNPVLDFGSAFGLKHPVGTALDGAVNLYVTDREKDRVLKFGLPDGLSVVILPPRPKEEKGGGFQTASLKSADASFLLRDIYVFPNPARGGAKPTLHVEVGVADRVILRIYDTAGREVHQATLDGRPPVLDRGAGPEYAYEYAWDGHIASGVYLYIMEAQKAGQVPWRKTGRFAVVR